MGQSGFPFVCLAADGLKGEHHQIAFHYIHCSYLQTLSG